MKHNASQKIENIIIVGGGSAGWMSASYLAKALNFDVAITVIDSEKIGRIGVGEATVPTIKSEFFDKLGLTEAEWMPHCQGTYKLGIRFADWKTPPTQGGDYYYHNFGEMPTVNDIPLTHIWMKKHLEENFDTPMAYACYQSVAACDLNKSPNFMDGTQVQHYAYHFDALALADFLRKWCLARGVKHISEELTHAELDDEGNIAAVVGKSGEKYYADLFVDCSGFAGFLIEKTLQEPIVEFSDSLLTDRAVALQIAQDPEKEGIRPYTSATALNAGWLWEIPLFKRAGTGYVYSSQFISDDEAESEIRGFFGEKSKNVEARFIKFQSRRRRRSWVKNCVSIGLASSFLEPLESTGLYFVYAALYQLVNNFPNKQILPTIRDQFNEKIRYMVEDVKEFIIMHFKTAMREDTPFWRANRYETKMPESLQLTLERHKAGLPIRKSYLSNGDLYASFESQFDNFWTNSNYQCILCGVGLLPESNYPLLNYRRDIMEQGEKLFKEIASSSKKLAESLPTQYQYLQQLYQKNTAHKNKIQEKEFA